MPFITNIFSFLLISYYKEKELTAGFGLGMSAYNLFFGQILIVNADTVGIYVSKFFGMKRYKSVNMTYYNGLIINAMIFLLFCFVYAKLDII